MVRLEGYDSGKVLEFASVGEVLEFLDEEFPRWWMEDSLVVTPAGPAYIRIN